MPAQSFIFIITDEWDLQAESMPIAWNEA